MVRRVSKRLGAVALATALAMLTLSSTAAVGADESLRTQVRALFGELPAPPRTLGAIEQLGRELFFDTRLGRDGRTGCVSCHLPEQWGADGRALSPDARGRLTERIDVGRFALTKEESDRYVFRVPILRNVARTPPYFHDGSVAALGGAVRIMARVQLGIDLPEAEIEALVAFLDSLTGEVPGQYAPPAG